MAGPWPLPAAVAPGRPRTYKDFAGPKGSAPGRVLRARHRTYRSPTSHISRATRGGAPIPATHICSSEWFLATLGHFSCEIPELGMVPSGILQLWMVPCLIVGLGGCVPPFLGSSSDSVDARFLNYQRLRCSAPPHEGRREGDILHSLTLHPPAKLRCPSPLPPQTMVLAGNEICSVEIFVSLRSIVVRGGERGKRVPSFAWG